MARTDVHSPANLQTENYEYLASFDLHHEEGNRVEHGEFRKRMAAQHTFANVYSAGRCDHCGAHLRYIAYLLHTPSNEIIKVGQTCLDNRFERATSDFRKLMQRAQTMREQRRIKGAREAYAEANPDVVEYLDNLDNPSDFEGDIRAKLYLYGELTERQTAAIRRGIERKRERAEAKAAKEANSEPVPEGRQTITGTIISGKTVDGPYGPVNKMLVEDDRGFRLFGTTPNEVFRATNNPPLPIIGQRVTFTATVEQSKDDALFGFYKRPAKVTVLL